jgi:hypothetical protein
MEMSGARVSSADSNNSEEAQTSRQFLMEAKPFSLVKITMDHLVF